jgi:hypothetical protein
MALYLHVGRFSRVVIARIENIIATLQPVVVEGRAHEVELSRPGQPTAV